MTVHALHIFDRKGKTLFTKRYSSTKQQPVQDAELLSENRKLIFGMLFSVRELVGFLTPEGESPGVYGAMMCVHSFTHFYVSINENAHHTDPHIL